VTKLTVPPPQLTGVLLVKSVFLAIKIPINNYHY
jgi:hypothetical protein